MQPQSYAGKPSQLPRSKQPGSPKYVDTTQRRHLNTRAPPCCCWGCCIGPAPPDVSTRRTPKCAFTSNPNETATLLRAPYQARNIHTTIFPDSTCIRRASTCYQAHRRPNTCQPLKRPCRQNRRKVRCPSAHKGCAAGSLDSAAKVVEHTQQGSDTSTHKATQFCTPHSTSRHDTKPHSAPPQSTR